MLKLRRLVRDFGGIFVIVSLLLLVTFLPPDTSLSEVQKNKVLQVCVPTLYPPLVTQIPERPGIDIEILEALADSLELELVLNPIDAMGRDFNPRNWAINRGKCQVIAGGVVDSTLTRSFLDTGPAYAKTGWAIVAPSPLQEIQGLRIGVLTLISGLDRIGLASYLRDHQVSMKVVRNREDLFEGIKNGEFAAGITEALMASQLAEERNWWVTFLPEELHRYNLVFGLWKGDLTLKREIVATLEDLKSNGVLSGILKRYGANQLQMASISKF